MWCWMLCLFSLCRAKCHLGPLSISVKNVEQLYQIRLMRFEGNASTEVLNVYNATSRFFAAHACDETKFFLDLTSKIQKQTPTVMVRFQGSYLKTSISSFPETEKRRKTQVSFTTPKNRTSLYRSMLVILQALFIGCLLAFLIVLADYCLTMHRLHGIRQDVHERFVVPDESPVRPDGYAEVPTSEPSFIQIQTPSSMHSSRESTKTSAIELSPKPP